MKLFGRKNQEKEFWDWFAANQSQIAAIATGGEPIIAQLTARLQRVNRGLAWEKGTLDDGRDDFVVSADGVRAVAPAVRALVDAAPHLPGWKITAFRPVREPEALTREGVSVDPQNVNVGLLASPPKGPYNLAIFLPGLTDENYPAFQGLAFLLLDGFLGEETVMSSLGEIQIRKNSMDRPAHCIPLPELKSSLGL